MKTRYNFTGVSPKHGHIYLFIFFMVHDVYCFFLFNLTDIIIHTPPLPQIKMVCWFILHFKQFNKHLLSTSHTMRSYQDGKIEFLLWRKSQPSKGVRRHNYFWDYKTQWFRDRHPGIRLPDSQFFLCHLLDMCSWESQVSVSLYLGEVN